MGGTTIGSVAMVSLGLVACSLSWSGVRLALLRTSDPTAALGSVLLFVVAWIGALALAGLAATWRSAAWSLVVMGDHRVGGPATIESGTL
jgi:hypothetical protein